MNLKYWAPLQIIMIPIAATKSFEDQISKKGKKQLAQIVGALNVNADKQKDKYVEGIAKKVAEMFEYNRNKNISDESTITEIQSRITVLSIDLSDFVKKAIRRLLETEKKQSITNNNFSGKDAVKNLANSSKCYCLAISNNPNTHAKSIVCIVCNNTFHQNCLKLEVKPEPFQCPSCYCTRMDPLNEVVEVVFSGYLKGSQKLQKIQFRLAQEYLKNGLKHQIEGRCLRLDGKNNYEQTWPDVGEVSFNSIKIAEFKPLVSNSSLKKRKDDSKIFNPNHLQKVNRVVFNLDTSTMNATKYRISSSNHFFMICLVNPLKPEQLEEKIKSKVMDKAISTKLLNDQFIPFGEIEIQRLDIGMKDVFSSLSIKTPVRGKYCNHFKCFDLKNMITATYKSRRWKCPICKENAHEMVVDPILMEIIDNHPKLKIKEVKFERDNLNCNIEFEKEEDEQEESYENVPQKYLKNQRKGPTITIDIDSDWEKQQTRIQKLEDEEGQLEEFENSKRDIKTYNETKRNQDKSKTAELNMEIERVEEEEPEKKSTHFIETQKCKSQVPKLPNKQPNNTILILQSDEETDEYKQSKKLVHQLNLLNKLKNRKFQENRGIFAQDYNRLTGLVCKLFQYDKYVN